MLGGGNGEVKMAAASSQGLLDTYPGWDVTRNARATIGCIPVRKSLGYQAQNSVTEPRTDHILAASTECAVRSHT
jgi:hypothetical protein